MHLFCTRDFDKMIMDKMISEGRQVGLIIFPKIILSAIFWESKLRMVQVR